MGVDWWASRVSYISRLDWVYWVLSCYKSKTQHMQPTSTVSILASYMSCRLWQCNQRNKKLYAAVPHLYVALLHFLILLLSNQYHNSPKCFYTQTLKPHHTDHTPRTDNSSCPSLYNSTYFFANNSASLIVSTYSVENSICYENAQSLISLHQWRNG